MQSNQTGSTVLAMGDPHCGHLLGLTPPAYQNPNWALSHVTAEHWRWFESRIPQKVDVAIWNGDMVEGEGRRDPTFHLTTDMRQQINMAIEIVEKVNAKKNIFVYGTPYHTGYVMDYEAMIADHFEEDIHHRQRISVNGVRFDCSHKASKTNTPVGGDIGLRKPLIWNMLYDAIDGRALAHYVLRSHTHEFRVVGNEHGTAINLPAMKLGAADFDRYPRGMDGWYSLGFLVFNCVNEQEHSWHKEIMKFNMAGDYNELITHGDDGGSDTTGVESQDKNTPETALR